MPGKPDVIHSTDSACPKCHHSMPAPSPQLFSFNGPQGACPQCSGIGTVATFDPQLIAPDQNLSLRQGALARFPSLHHGQTGKGADRAGQTAQVHPGHPAERSFRNGLQGAFPRRAGGINRTGSLRRNFMGGTSLNNETIREARFSQEYDVSTEHWPGVMYLLERAHAEQ